MVSGIGASSLYGSTGVLSTTGGVATGNSVVSSQLSRFQTYHPAALSAAMNMNSLNQQAPPTLTRNDRRALASFGIVPTAPTGLPKHRYGSRKLAGNTRTMISNADYDWKSGSYTGIDNAYGMIDPRLDSQPSGALRRRTLSASGLKTCPDSIQGNGTRAVNPRVLAANVAGGSQTNLSSPGGVTPGAHAQQYMCSMYTFPNVLKVAPQPQNGMNLSVISGPAPVSYRPSQAGVGSEHADSTQRIGPSPSGLTR